MLGQRDWLELPAIFGCHHILLPTYSINEFKSYLDTHCNWPHLVCPSTPSGASSPAACDLCADIVKTKLLDSITYYRHSAGVSEFWFSDAAAQQWCKENFPRFWEKGIWPGNSPDLNPIENIWSAIQQKIDEEKPSVNITGLVRQLKRAWANISPSVLANLAAGMPNRMHCCIAVKGGFVGK